MILRICSYASHLELMNMYTERLQRHGVDVGESKRETSSKLSQTQKVRIICINIDLSYFAIGYYHDCHKELSHRPKEVRLSQTCSSSEGTIFVRFFSLFLLAAFLSGHPEVSLQERRLRANY